jgi:hypothetical protein
MTFKFESNDGALRLRSALHQHPKTIFQMKTLFNSLQKSWNLGDSKSPS